MDNKNESDGTSGYKPELWEKITVVTVSVCIVVLVGWLVIRNQRFADPNLVVILRTIISLAVAVLGATIPGFLQIDWTNKGKAIRAGGALALFVATFLMSPKVVKMDYRSGGIEAKDGWEKGTTVIMEALRDQASRYPEKLRAELGVSQQELGNLTDEQKKKAQHVHEAIYREFEEEGHQLFLRAHADPRVINPALRKCFSDVQVKYTDGSPVSMDEATRSGREMHRHFFDLVLEAVLKGEKPLSNETVLKQLDNYLERRQAVTEAIESQMAEMH